MKEENKSFLKVDSIVKTYGDNDNFNRVIDGISFELEKGVLCALLGPSGSGKSTLLNVIGGLENIDSGRVIVDGIDVTSLSSKKLTEYRREKLGFVFQFYNLIGDLNVKENIEVGAEIVGNPMDIHELINSLGLEEHWNKLPSQISGGQQQRCAIGRALVKKPKLLLCDEPTGALDYKTSKDILRLIEKIVEEYGTTVIIATHNEEITRMAQRILRIKDGKVVLDIINDDVKKASELEW
ncbi:MAG: ABC transporter ATP-binding protein [Peptostreptococcus porci]|uniref:ABC transporter ATP-binding protein n=1 Tax=Peptostreptococcus porci TaxID=2652282 RepID=A0A6N7XHV8_9FIRM|nr:ABC transporter ATP-binding protein [Peptostreptococcus porci]MDY2795541.1 ABC transporter ATP-binding protein [Peptostreptococcus porci]MDY5478864.1 ABC transporter ATP-binding protein [Peptostreptococcus porci]MST62984.1 ABC transporter ATP-binding protein [Peptostreptococcus porci]